MDDNTKVPSPDKGDAGKSGEAKPPELKGQGDFLDWTTWAIEDYVYNLGQVVSGAAKLDTNKTVRATASLLSLKRWAFLLPGGQKMHTPAKSPFVEIKKPESTVTPPASGQVKPPPPPKKGQ